MKCLECGRRQAAWRDPRNPPLDDENCLCDECFMSAAAEVADELEGSAAALRLQVTELGRKSASKDHLRIVRRVYDAAGGLRSIAGESGIIGTDLESYLQNVADEIEGSMISCGEKLGWTLDDVIVGDFKKPKSKKRR